MRAFVGALNFATIASSTVLPIVGCFVRVMRQQARVRDQRSENRHFETMPCVPIEKETTMSRSMTKRTRYLSVT